jgi:hypothetical protein
MVGENKNDKIGDPFELLIEESLMQQRNDMMDSFAQILWWLHTGDASSLNRGATPFKVQINKWLNLLEGYFSIHNFSNK